MANVIIPNHLAGVGDVVCVKFSGGEVSDKIVIKGTTFSSAPSGYTLYGIIYGFEKGCARLFANASATKSWAAPASGSWSGGESAGGIVGDTTIGWGSITMRNGLKGTYANMNTSKVAYEMRNSTGDTLHPNNAYYGNNVAMSRNHFNTATTANAKLARQIYKTYEEYLDQMSPLLTPEVAIVDPNNPPLGGPFSIRCGKENTAILGQWTASNPDTSPSNTAPCWYPAANYCYNYAVGSESVHHWWLSDMNELDGIFEEANYNKIQTTTGINKPSTGSYYWSCVRYYSATRTWHYYMYGVSDSSDFCNGFTALPVTLLKL